MHSPRDVLRLSFASSNRLHLISATLDIGCAARRRGTHHACSLYAHVGEFDNQGTGICEHQRCRESLTTSNARVLIRRTCSLLLPALAHAD